MNRPPSPIEILDKFRTEAACIAHLAHIRWPLGVECLRCHGRRISEFDTTGKTGKPRHLYACMDCKYQFSVTTGTIFHDSHVSLTKWYLAIYLICSAKKGVSAKQLQRELAVSYKTAWYMAHRIRLAMQEDSEFCPKFVGGVEVDETSSGGTRAGTRGRGAANRVPVVGRKDRTSGHIRMQAVDDVKGTTLAECVRTHTAKGSRVYTDEFSAYLWLDSSEFTHSSVRHRETYVDGDVHTNGVENVWSLFTRGIMGIFHKVSAKYLPLYLDEFSFRFNSRDGINLLDKVLATCF